MARRQSDPVPRRVRSTPPGSCAAPGRRRPSTPPIAAGPRQSAHGPSGGCRAGRHHDSGGGDCRPARTVRGRGRRRGARPAVPDRPAVAPVLRLTTEGGWPAAQRGDGWNGGSRNPGRTASGRQRSREPVTEGNRCVAGSGFPCRPWLHKPRRLRGWKRRLPGRQRSRGARKPLRVTDAAIVVDEAAGGAALAGASVPGGSVSRRRRALLLARLLRHRHARVTLNPMKKPLRERGLRYSSAASPAGSCCGFAYRWEKSAP